MSEDNNPASEPAQVMKKFREGLQERIADSDRRLGVAEDRVKEMVVNVTLRAIDEVSKGDDASLMIKFSKDLKEVGKQTTPILHSRGDGHYLQRLNRLADTYEPLRAAFNAALNKVDVKFKKELLASLNNDALSTAKPRIASTRRAFLGTSFGLTAAAGLGGFAETKLIEAIPESPEVLAARKEALERLPGKTKAANELRNISGVDPEGYDRRKNVEEFMRRMTPEGKAVITEEAKKSLDHALKVMEEYDSFTANLNKRDTIKSIAYGTGYAVAALAAVSAAIQGSMLVRPRKSDKTAIEQFNRTRDTIANQMLAELDSSLSVFREQEQEKRRA